jgi:cobalamin biosynthesis protein CbiG
VRVGDSPMGMGGGVEAPLGLDLATTAAAIATGLGMAPLACSPLFALAADTNTLTAAAAALAAGGGWFKGPLPSPHHHRALTPLQSQRRSPPPG